MVEIEVRNVPRQALGIGQSRMGIGGGMTSNSASAVHGVANRLRPPVGGTGRAATLANVDRHAQASLAVMFQRFNFTQANGDRQGAAETDGRLGGRGALDARLGENVVDQGCQLFPRGQRGRGSSNGCGHRKNRCRIGYDGAAVENGIVG